MDDGWNADKANEYVRFALEEIEKLGEKLSPARAEALLDEFERDIHLAFLREDLGAVMNITEEYSRRFRILGEDE
jgi:hypothetical protein